MIRSGRTYNGKHFVETRSGRGQRFFIDGKPTRYEEWRAEFEAARAIEDQKTMIKLNAEERAELLRQFIELTDAAEWWAIEQTAHMTLSELQEQVYMIRIANGEQL